MCMKMIDVIDERIRQDLLDWTDGLELSAKDYYELSDTELSLVDFYYSGEEHYIDVSWKDQDLEWEDDELCHREVDITTHYAYIHRVRYNKNGVRVWFLIQPSRRIP